MSDTIVNERVSIETHPPEECNNVSKMPRTQRKTLSCFDVPYKITPQLCVFMDKPVNSAIPLNDAIKHIIRYINNNNLQKKDDRVSISYDKKLWDVLNIPDGDSKGINTQLKYIDIHTKILQHFIINV